MTRDLRYTAVYECAAALDRRWSSERKVAAVTLAVRIANLTAGKVKPSERESLSAVRGAAREVLESSRPVAGLADANWEATSRRAADWLRLAVITPRVRLFRNQRPEYRERDVRLVRQAAPLFRAWTTKLHAFERLEPRPLDEWIAAGAALVAEPTATYGLETTRKTFRERSGICAAVRCGKFFFLRHAKDGKSPPTGPAPRTCSNACADRAADQEK